MTILQRRNPLATQTEIALSDGPPGDQIVELRPDQIVIDAGLQTRDVINLAAIEEYAADMQRGDQFPPLLVCQHAGAYALVKGFHRIQAHVKTFGNDKPIRCKVMIGSRREALRVALGDNSDHGLRLSNDDKRKKVKIALADDEWGAWSDREIAELCKVSHPFVGKVRREVTGNISSDNGAGASPITGNISSDNERTYTNRHGGQSTMKIGGISQANAERKAAQPTPARVVYMEQQPAPTSPAYTAEPLIPTVPTIPSDLATYGWELRQIAGAGKWWAHNRAGSKATGTYEDPADAIAEAYSLQRNLKTPAVTTPNDGERARALAALYQQVIESLPDYRRLTGDNDRGRGVIVALQGMIKDLGRAQHDSKPT